MAGAAGLALFHILHGRRVGATFGGENRWVTFRAAKLLIMHRVREGDFADIFVGKRNINGLAVAGGAVTLDAEGHGTVMTGAAGLALLHVLHG